MTAGKPMTVTEFLFAHVPFLADLSRDDARRLAVATEQVSLQRGQLLLLQGAPMPGLLVVASGSLVALTRTQGPSRRGKELGPGEVFGPKAALGPATSEATLQALDASLVFVIPRTALAPIVQRYPALRARVEAAAAGPATALPKTLAEGLEPRRLIAEGGMGSVYEAFDTVLNRRVAVKRLRPEMRLDPRAEERFLQEARIVAALRHPAIVEIFSIAKSGGELYLVFEYVDGPTLEGALRERGPLELAECLRVLRPVAEAVEFAHAHRVVHRDLKPGNVMLGVDGVVKVMDFGIARQAKDTISRLSRTEPFATFAYAAPEQHFGEGRRQADIFSLAVTAYQMLTGELPFPGPDYLSQKEAGIFAPATLRAQGSLPAALDEVLAKALSRDPNLRHARAREFLEALEAASRS